jgi:protein-L-isoaspartate(D-aspartate) O-methyltransferase
MADPSAARDRAAARERMVREQLQARGVRSERVLEAFLAVPRERFVAPDQAWAAYDDRPLPIGEGQTISQPYVVGVMIEALDLQDGDTVLEVGAGSGYAAAILARLAGRVHAVERHASLAADARARLQALGLDVDLRTGDGRAGLPDVAPFDAILVSAGATSVPDRLVEQLAPGGRLVVPVGRGGDQELLRIARSLDGTLTTDRLGHVRFVPFVGG